VEIINVFGETVYSKQFTTRDEQFTIDAYDISHGIYFVRMIDAEKTITEKIIIE
jgi:hypothetical protein